MSKCALSRLDDGTPPTRNCLPLSAPPRHSHLDALEMIASDLLWAVVVAHVLLPWPRHASTSHTCIRTHKHTPAQCHLVRELGRHHQRDKKRERGKGEKETKKKAKTQKRPGRRKMPCSPTRRTLDDPEPRKAYHQPRPPAGVASARLQRGPPDRGGRGLAEDWGRSTAVAAGPDDLRPDHVFEAGSRRRGRRAPSPSSAPGLDGLQKTRRFT